jgi:ferredoxin-NADP reductase
MENDIVFKNEFDALMQKYPTKIIHIVSDDPAFNGEKGRIDEEKIKRFVPDISMRDVYLCGPPPMMDGVLSILKKIGLSKHKIHYEKFAF